MRAFKASRTAHPGRLLPGTALLPPAAAFRPAPSVDWIISLPRQSSRATLVARAVAALLSGRGRRVLLIDDVALSG